jgi:methionyl-tRNA formyltransferase
MLLRQAVPIGPETTAIDLHDALAELGAGLILRTLEECPAPVPQPEQGATYAPKLTRADGQLDWTRPASELDRRVRGLLPWPGAWTGLRGETLKILRARPEPGSGPPGTALDDRLLIACGEGALRLLRVQRPGRGPLEAEAMLRGVPVATGTRLG